MGNLIFFLFLLLLVVGGILYTIGEFLKNQDFTPWMSLQELKNFLASLEAKVPSEQNFWDKGHWINAVEGRWRSGIPQFRICLSEVPPHCRYEWYWFFNQDQESFSQLVHDYANKGFELVYHNKFKRPDDTRRYNGVWRKWERQKNPVNTDK